MIDFPSHPIDEEAAAYMVNDEEELARLERLRMSQDAASAGRTSEELPRFPEPEERGYYLSDLFGKAAYADASMIMEQGVCLACDLISKGGRHPHACIHACMHTPCKQPMHAASAPPSPIPLPLPHANPADFPEAAAYGLQNDPDKVIKGDMFVCTCEDLSKVAAQVQLALENEASSLLLPIEAEDLPGLAIPPGMPCHYVGSVPEVAHRLAVAFYDAPGRDMLMIGVVGSHGKTTVSWLICGILEAMDQVTGGLGGEEQVEGRGF
jgi:hypothetical protein